MRKQKVLILGSSCWVAHYLIKDLLDNNFEVIGISNKNKPNYPIENYSIDMNSSQYITKIKSLEVDSIINMIHSNDYEVLFEIHKSVAKYTKEKEIHYTYISSGNAVDGDPTHIHLETELPYASSEYGKYKARCEEFLIEDFSGACIVRFPQAHGWAPNRLSRTEEFLIKLQNNSPVEVPQGIKQNRPFTGHLSLMITELIKNQESGIFHLGTVDESDEVDFLQKLAVGFGYEEKAIKAGKKYHFHITTKPEKIYSRYGDRYKFEQKDTIASLIKSPELKKYLK